MRILLADDGSDSAGTAVELVAGRQWAPGSWVRIVAVDDAYGVDRAELEPHLEQVRERLRASGLRAETALLAGRAGSVLLDQANRHEVDMVVVGNRGRGRIGSAVLGSVSAEVVERARCSVLVVRRPRADRLLVAVDGSPASARVTRVICSAEAFEGMRALVVSVSRDRDPFPPNLDLKAARVATRVAAELRACGLIADREVLVGEPAATIVARAGGWDADVVAVGSRGISGLRRLLLGSVARNVTLYAPCSVLVVRRLPAR